MRELVTVAVATYHSAAYVYETLESIYHQTYQNISLIISDDCSTDDTVKVVEEWVALEKVQKRFKSIQLIKVPKNTGVSANCNRCIAATPSDWLKFIAGDDILLPYCIEDNMVFVSNNPEVNIAFSQVKLYQDTFKETNYIKTTPLDFPNNLMHESLNAKEQYQLLLVSDRINYTPSLFLNKQAILKVGGYDEENKLIEDYPMWLKLTSSGERLYYFHKITVGYRIHSKSTNNSGENVLFKPSTINNYDLRKKYAHPYLSWEIVKSEKVVYLISCYFQKWDWNINKNPYRLIYRMGCFYINPFYYVYSLKKRLPKNKNNLFYS